jgi:hypothetical protein
MDKKKLKPIDYEIVIFRKLSNTYEVYKTNVESYDKCYNIIFNYCIQLSSCFIKDGILSSHIIDDIERKFIYGEMYFETRLLTFFIHKNDD